MHIKYDLIGLFLSIFFLFGCSEKSDRKKELSPHKKTVDSLTIVKQNETSQADKLKHEIDSLKKHLDSIKAITSDSLQ